MSASDYESGRPVPDRTLIEKGLSYQIDQRINSIRRLASQWHGNAEQLNMAISDSSDPNEITLLRDELIKVMKDLRLEYGIVKSLLSTSVHEEPVHRRYEDIEQEHHRLISTVSEILRDIKSEASEARSHSSKHSCRSSRESTTSHLSEKQELAAKAESLKIKLKYLDVEAKAKLEYDRIQALKNLDITKATLEVHETQQEDEFNLGINLPTESKEDLVKKYVSKHSQDVNPNLPEMSDKHEHAEQIDVKNVTTSIGPTTTMFNSTVPPVPPVSAFTFPPEIHTGKSAFKVTTQENKQSMLNLLAGSFLPPISTGNIHVNATDTVQPHNNRDDRLQQGPTELAKTLADQVSLGRLPPPEPTVFSGDSLLYSSWKAAFQTLIEQRRIPKTEQIHYLKKYLSGAAKESVDHYFLLSSDSAFDEAKQVLEERFGDPFIIGNAFRDTIERWPKIAARDSKALLKISDFLKQCKAAMDSIGTLRILDDDRENRKMLSKLPDWIVTRWSRIVHQWKEDQRRFPPFKCFVDFICKEAKIASDSVTSSH